MRSVKHFIQQSWLLMTAAFVFGLLLAVTGAALKPKIEQNEKEKLNAKMRELIVEAKDFSVAVADVEIAGAKTDIYKAVGADGKTIGFALVASGPGFADKIKLVIAVDAQCQKYFGYSVLFSNETPGFGSRIKEDYYRNQFKGAPAEKLELTKAGDDKKIDEQIVAISGATVSSEAVIKIFNKYIEQVKKILTEQGLIGDVK